MLFAEILFSLDTTKREALKETMDSASNLKRILENSKNRRVLPPPPSAAADESVIESGEVKLNKLRLDLQCEEWGRKGTVFTGAIDGIEVDPVARANEARIRELEKELLEMEGMIRDPRGPNPTSFPVVLLTSTNLSFKNRSIQGGERGNWRRNKIEPNTILSKIREPLFPSHSHPTLFVPHTAG